MFRFAHPAYLYLLGLILLFAVLHYVALMRRRKRIQRYGDPELVKQLFVDVSCIRPELKLWLCLSAFAMFVLALARPQNGTKQVEHERYGIEAMVALDISNSMMAQDVHPSRLDKSKRLVSNMMNEMQNDQIGLVIFAGDAFIQIPITSDFVSAKMFLDQVTPDMIKLQGTDMARAIELCSRSFTQREDVNRAIFIITDGEDNEGGAVEAAKAAADKGIHTFVLGVGSPQGAHIPIAGTTQYMIDDQGNYVKSCLNESMCREIAQAGQGSYIYVDNSSSAQEALNQQIDKLAKTKLDTVSYSEYNEKYQLFLLLGVILLLLDVLILARENHVFRRINLFNATPLLALLVLASCQGNSTRDHLRRGNRAFRDAKNDTTALDRSITEYQKAIEKDSLAARAHYNQGDALLMQGQDSLAFSEFQKAKMAEENPQRLSQTNHNMGYVMQSNEQLQQAVELYKEALRKNPHDDETRYNLALCLWQLKNQQNQDQNGGGGGGEDNQQQDQNGQNDKQDQNDNQDQNGKDNNQDQNNQNDKQDPQESQQNQPKKDEISREAAEQMLNAAMQNERQTQDRLQRYNQRKEEQGQPQNRRLQKNW
ncbi:MAG: VWA domain-containing protein [Bacteroidales bacterium]|nr:VWA domain-containing protein [Candidatus Physcousia equi]